MRAKARIAAWARALQLPQVCIGAAGGKHRPQDVEILDLAETTHDPLLANLRQRLRKFHAAPRAGKMGVTCVFSREPVTRPEGVAACDLDANLNCHGYGSSVAVTAGFGMVAAAELVRRYLKALARPQKSVL